MNLFRRIPPCPEYDIEGRQAWLEELALEGYRPDSFGSLFVYFKQAEPQAIRYRLQPLLQKKEPPSAAIDLAAEYGWTYLGSHGRFAFYSTKDPNARELDTDPQVQALVIGQLLRRLNKSYLVLLAFVLLFLLPMSLHVGPLVLLAENTVLINWIIPLYLLFGIWIAVSELRHLYGLRRQLKLGQPLSLTKNWRNRKLRHQISLVSVYALYLFMLLAIVGNNHLPWETYRWRPVEDPLPFAELEDLSPNGVFAIGNWVMENNHQAARRSTALMKEQIKFQQYGYLFHEDGTVSNCMYTAEYYDVRFAWLAKALFRQIHDLDQRQSNAFSRQKYQPLPLQDVSTEDACFYATPYSTLLLRSGSRVLQVEFLQLTDPEEYESHSIAIVPDAQWTAAVADSFAP